jgi:IS5 family transposase
MRSNFQQGTLAMATGFERYAKKTRRAEFLEEMELVVPWAELVALVEPHYPKAGNGRRPVGVERMLGNPVESERDSGLKPNSIPL